MTGLRKNVGLTVLVLVLLFAVGAISYGFGKRVSQPEGPGGEETPAAGEVKEYLEIGDRKIKVKDEPDEASFKKYFSELYISRTDPHPRFDEDLKLEPTSVFGLNDWFALYGTTIEEVELFLVFIDPKTGENIPGHDIQFPPKLGQFMIGGVLGLNIGKYELRVYIKDTLVKVFPVEIKQLPE